MAEGGVVVWKCPDCGRTWHKSGSKPNNYCFGDGKRRHAGQDMQAIPVIPREQVEGLLRESDEQIDTLLKWIVNDWEWNQDYYDAANDLRDRLAPFRPNPEEEE